MRAPVFCPGSEIRVRPCHECHSRQLCEPTTKRPILRRSGLRTSTIQRRNRLKRSRREESTVTNTVT